MRPLASLSLDLDNEWSYLKTRGDPAWREHPSYLDIVVPRVLEELERRSLRITVFVVGQDAAIEANRDVLAAITAAGHEVGNHSFRHEPWLQTYSEEELEIELGRAEDAIREATGSRPRGFRGPGYSLSMATLRVLVRRGYEYDASTLPTYLGPLARLLYFRRAQLDEAQRRERARLFGSFRDGLRPVRPYRWDVQGTELLELPVTTLPALKVPFHVSYLLTLASYSPALARSYFGGAMAMCKFAGIGPSLLLHPLDFLDVDDVPSLGFFPAMRLPTAAKIAQVHRYLDRLESDFEVVTVADHAAALETRTDLRSIRPDLPAAGSLASEPAA